MGSAMRLVVVQRIVDVRWLLAKGGKKPNLLWPMQWVFGFNAKNRISLV